MANPICVLKVDICNCKACWVNLKKLLSEIDGVVSVDVDAEKELVTVSGKVDPGALLKQIGQKKKKAEIVFYDKNPSMNAKNKTIQKKKEKCHSCGCDNDKSTKSDEKPKDDHKCEPYVAPKMDERVCRDPFCKIHLRKPKIPEISFKMPVFRPPPMNRTFYGAPPRNTHYPGYYREDPSYGDWQGPLRPPPQFPPRAALPPRYYGY